MNDVQHPYILHTVSWQSIPDTPTL